MVGVVARLGGDTWISSGNSCLRVLRVGCAVFEMGVLGTSFCLGVDVFLRDRVLVLVPPSVSSSLLVNKPGIVYIDLRMVKRPREDASLSAR